MDDGMTDIFIDHKTESCINKTLSYNSLSISLV